MPRLMIGVFALPWPAVQSKDDAPVAVRVPAYLGGGVWGSRQAIVSMPPKAALASNRAPLRTQQGIRKILAR